MSYKHLGYRWFDNKKFKLTEMDFFYYLLVPKAVSSLHLWSKVCMVSFHVRSEVCIAPFYVRIKD